MVKPRDQDLYLLQNEHGLIKIGRSIDIAERLTQLGQSERCAPHFIVRFSSSGHTEEAANISLGEHRLIGEWFCGSEEARIAIEDEFGIENIQWPFDFDAAGASKWVTHMREVRNVRHLKKAIYREYAILRDADAPHQSHDVSIFVLLRRPFIDAVGAMEMHMVAGKLTRLHRDRASGELKPIPPYTSDVQSALNIWPEKSRPSEWRDSAIECCVAGLSALNASIREVPRLE